MSKGIWIFIPETGGDPGALAGVLIFMADGDQLGVKICQD